MKNTEKRVIALGLAAFAGLAVRARSRLELDRKPAPQEVSNNFMKSQQLGITYIGGPTCLLEFGGVRLLTDPTFGPAGGEYKSASSTLRKLVGPALDPEAIGFIDYVLLSHDHHFDNLDHTGRSVLGKARAVFTTAEGAARLAGNSRGAEGLAGCRSTGPKPARALHRCHSGTAWARGRRSWSGD